jgi:hypothetical protein
MIRRTLFVVVLAAISAIPTPAAPRLKPEKPTIPPLAGTSWAGKTAEGWDMTITFAADGKMTYGYRNNTHTTASWKQDGDKVYYEMNDRYCEFDGTLAGDVIDGQNHNVQGRTWTTRLTRVREH